MKKPVGRIRFSVRRTGGIVELKASIKREIKLIKFRGTFVFEEVRPDCWRVVHERFSRPAADPYGIGDWLK